MRLKLSGGYGQAVLLLVIILFFPVLSGCRRTAEELPVLPGVTHPLARDYIGFGVVNGSFTHLLDSPGREGVSQGYLRRGTVVRIIERRSLVNRNAAESWVLVEDSSEASAVAGSSVNGWLQESVVDVYENESRARTASKSMNR